ncbi:MAG TPA: hypothetical protein PLI12_08345, partial [Acetobacteraceae bacterium]|nr:hypothetical protein [Acetobacteraceae bacterium]
LQLALTGVKEMSVIATPPVDRTAVRTFVLPYDPAVLREAILRERYRGGQVFYVCPRLADIDRVAERLQALAERLSEHSADRAIIVGYQNRRYAHAVSPSEISSNTGR